MPFPCEFYLADILAENAATLAVLGGFLIGWHGWSSSRAKLAKNVGKERWQRTLAKNLAILAAHVNGTL
jgi:hypothetical protein